MVREAQENADADKKRKEAADVVNESNNLIFQVKKSLDELKGVSEDEKKDILAKCDDLQKSIDANDIEGMKSKKEVLQKAAQDLATRVYQQQAQANNGGNNNNNGGQNNGSSDKKDDNVVDADFSDVQ
jgi:molecular chaperone DnaK